MAPSNHRPSNHRVARLAPLHSFGRETYLNSASAPNVTRRQAASRETYVPWRASAANVTRQSLITAS
ncbi:hypothetical protein BHE74_00001136 [Ensete ventricosum]|nr:hypothetical protein GW17_00010984 [Ensete ventricosum]RWW89823.1 hypothetical protein BHE74_00001136 [Ensete ventricosum]